MTTIRRACSNEAHLLRDLEEDGGALFRTVPGYEWIADEKSRSAEEWRALIENEAVWIAEDNGGSPQGFLAACAFDCDLFVAEVSVRTAAQGQGLGRALMNVASDHARRIGCRAMTLTTFCAIPWNAPAYARLGYELLSELAMPSYIIEILDKEVKAGLPREQRCAMELVLR